MKPALVVGAGLSGLATAWRLAERGFSVTVAEAGPGPGGLIQTRRTPYGPAESAANAFVWSDAVAEWFAALEIEPVFARPESRRRYIFRDGRPRRWPLSVLESTTFAGRLGFTLATRGFGARDGETLAAWGDRVTGAAARRWLLEPAMQGIYAAPAATLSARAVFGSRRRSRPRLAAPPDGMGQFVNRLHDRLRARGVQFRFDTRVESIDAETPTALCTGAGETANLVAPYAPDFAAAASNIGLAALVSITAFYPLHPGDLHGFGVLFPAGCGVGALGALINTDIFEGRGRTRSETWIYSDAHGVATTWDDRALLQALDDDRRQLTGRPSPPAHTSIARWPRAIPVYDEAVLRIASLVPTLPPWLAVAGNYLGAIGVSRLLEGAGVTAARLDEFCRTNRAS